MRACGKLTRELTNRKTQEEIQNSPANPSHLQKTRVAWKTVPYTGLIMEETLDYTSLSPRLLRKVGRNEARRLSIEVIWLILKRRKGSWVWTGTTWPGMRGARSISPTLTVLWWNMKTAVLNQRDHIAVRFVLRSLQRSDHDW